MNLGLTWMAFFKSFSSHARSLDFLMFSWVNKLEWARLPGDALFILGGALPLVWLSWRGVRFPNPRGIAADAELPARVFTYESEASKS
jgi:nitric oxide reductase subunit B